MGLYFVPYCAVKWRRKQADLMQNAWQYEADNSVVWCKWRDIVFFLGLLKVWNSSKQSCKWATLFLFGVAEKSSTQGHKVYKWTSFSVAFGWLHHAKSIDNCLCFQGEKRHFVGWLAIVCEFSGPALSVVFNLEWWNLMGSHALCITKLC